MDLSFDKLYSVVAQGFEKIVDHRAHNVRYPLLDILKGGFAVFSLKSPSILSFGNRTQIEDHNLCSVYDIGDIPSDNCFRQTLDEVDPSHLRSVFVRLYKYMKKNKQLDNYQIRGRYKIVSIDGVHHYSSEKVHCLHCLVTHHSSGKTSYQHSMLAAVLVHPEQREVFPLDCEPIINEDGKAKNDCELNASKRLLISLFDKYKSEKFILVEDALYSVNPNIKQILENGWSYVLGIKPKRHKVVFSLLEARKKRDQLDTFTVSKDGKTHTYSMMNNIPLNNQQDTVRVNVLHYEQEDKKGKQKIFTWVTDIKLTHQNAPRVAQIGRSRWKIENETFNTLKNQGYHFDHNFGHGHKNLCTVLAVLMFLAFCVDQIQQHACQLFNALWDHIKQKNKLWESMRAIFMIKECQSMHLLFLNMCQIWNVRYPDP